MTFSDLTNQIMIPESGMVGATSKQRLQASPHFFLPQATLSSLCSSTLFSPAPLGSLFTGYNGKGGTHGYSSSWNFTFLFPCPYLPCISQQLLLHNFFCKMSYTDLRNVLNLLPTAHLNASPKSYVFSHSPSWLCPPLPFKSFPCSTLQVHVYRSKFNPG